MRFLEFKLPSSTTTRIDDDARIRDVPSVTGKTTLIADIRVRSVWRGSPFIGPQGPQYPTRFVRPLARPLPMRWRGSRQFRLLVDRPSD
jgi:hypothetical protein